MKSYLREKLRADAFAGLTVAVMGVPQAMAYALIAGLPPVYGLYTAIVTCVVAAALGSSSHLVTGPTNALCMVMLSLTVHLPEKYGVSVLEIIFLLSLMIGVIQVIFGLLRLGRIVRYVSNSVVIGFTAGAGILIAFNQIPNLLGVDLSGANAERFYEVVIATIRHIPQTNPYALGVGLATVLIVIAVPKIDRRLPAALLGVVVTGLACYLLGWHTSEELGELHVGIVRDIEPIRGSLPGFHLPELLRHPDYELTRELGGGALALALLGLVEAASISRTVAASTSQRLNFTREFFAQGVAKIVGSFFQCFAGSGSFTRTAVCHRSGGRTRMAAIFSAGWTALALVAFGDVANFIPKAALAGILVVIAFSMIDKHRLRLAWRSGKSPRLILLGTLASTLILPLEFAIFVGVFLSFVVVLRTTGKTDLTQLATRTDGGFEEVPFKRAAASPVATVNMEGDFYFAAADDLDYELLECITPQTRVIVLRMKRLRAVGSTAMAMLGHFSKLLRERGLHLVVCGIEGELERVMTGSGLRQRLGEENIFYADNKLFQSTELALARAWSIVEMEQRDDLATKAMGKAPDSKIRAGDIMSPRCIRFGDQHQLREALWLMSELQKHTKSLQPTPLFLQDKEAKLAGKISPWQILGVLAAGVDGAHDLEDAALGKMFRKDFTRLIAEIARDDFARHGKDALLEDLLDSMAMGDLQVVPICDDAGRIKGLVSADDVLRSVVTMLPDPDKGAAHG